MSSPYTSDAVKLLDAAACGEDDSVRRLVMRHLAGMQAVGYAVLAVDERLGALATAVAGTSEWLAEIADRLPDRYAARRARRWWPRARRRTELAAASQLVTGNDVPVLLQALADAAGQRLDRAGGDCLSCVRERVTAREAGTPEAAADLERCGEHARDVELAAAYAVLRFRLGGEA